MLDKLIKLEEEKVRYNGHPKDKWLSGDKYKVYKYFHRDCNYLYEYAVLNLRR